MNGERNYGEVPNLENEEIKRGSIIVEVEAAALEGRPFDPLTLPGIPISKIKEILLDLIENTLIEVERLREKDGVEFAIRADELKSDEKAYRRALKQVEDDEQKDKS